MSEAGTNTSAGSTGMSEVVGRTAIVHVPATSANLGPGFDACGLALDLWDRLEVSVIPSGLEISVTGEGAATVPQDERHLVISTLRYGGELLGFSFPGLRFRAHNSIPHSRGLGSSAAAIVGGLAAAWRLAYPDRELNRDWLLDVSSTMEGHPDNASAAVFGGYTVAWFDAESAGGEVRAGRQPVRPTQAISLPADPRIAALVLVPEQVLPTEHARAVLPLEVLHAEAALNAGRAALLTRAITGDPQHLLAATEDWLHQQARSTQMPQSLDLVRRLRAAGWAAVVSGAGPTVVVLGERDQLAALVAAEPAEAGHSNTGRVDAPPTWQGFAASLLEIGTGVSCEPVRPA